MADAHESPDWWRAQQQPRPYAPVEPVYFYPAPEPAEQPERDRGWFEDGAGTAFAKSATCALLGWFCPFSSWGTLTTSWTHLLIVLGITSEDRGAQIVAGVVSVAGIVLAWNIDPGDLQAARPAGKLTFVIRRILSRVLRWATLTGTALCLPVGLGIVNLGTGVH
ncbi:hypothetical protein ACWC0C_07015 [Streptomyces sp. NPDC001709]